MAFCREFHISPKDYPEQPADDVVQWRQMWAAEIEGETLRRKIEESRAKARQH